MKKIILMLLFILMSCSIKTDFFIVNNSTKMITIEYEFKEIANYGGFISNPEIMELNWLSKLKKVQNSELSIDLNKKFVICSLQSGQFIKIGWIGNYSPKSEYKRNLLSENLKKLKITTNGNHIKVITQKDSIAKLFKRVNSKRYEIKIVE
ncbi:hypothetical protein [Polaribacter sp.]|uniref:hypothetical protein n=1 Tax=Polaribacter sp. TaxID=1920175 RepID=UPI003F6B4E9A